MTALVGAMPNGNGTAPLASAAEHQLGIYEELMAKVPEIKQALFGLNDRRDQLIAEHQARLRELNVEKQRLHSLLKALGEDFEPPKRRAKKASAGRVKVSARVLLQLIGAIEKHADIDEFPTSQIHEECNADWSLSYSSAGMSHLRDHEFIGLVREEGVGGRGVYRVLDRAVGQRLREQLESDDATQRDAASSRRPSDFALARVIATINILGSEEFATLDVANHLGQKSPKGTYTVVKWMRDNGMVEEVGQRHVEGERARTLYKLVSETPVAENA